MAKRKIAAAPAASKSAKRKKVDKKILALVHDHFGPKGQAARAAKEAAEKLKREKEFERDRRKDVLESIKSALDLIQAARDVTQAIEEEVDGASYFQHQELARFARLELEAGGSQLEQTLCNLGLVKETDYGYFHEPLRRTVKTQVEKGGAA